MASNSPSTSLAKHNAIERAWLTVPKWESDRIWDARSFAFDPVTKEAYFETSAQASNIRDKPLKGAWYYYALAGNA